jgi:hypothetical protein
MKNYFDFEDDGDEELEENGEYTFAEFMIDRPYIEINGRCEFDEIDFKLLSKKIEESDFLQGITDMTFFCNNYYRIINDKYVNYKKS